ncbi:MAG: LytTR family transcriptional regulator DNA-binding domain-containing protein [Bacteroidota bacterium]
MQRTRIGIVEDEFIIASDIQSTLQELDYDVPAPCKNYDEAIAMLVKERPDIAILDIQLAGSRDGVDVAEYIRQHIDIPFIFLTANSDAATVERVKKVQPNAYLTKPFQKKDLHVSIEIALSNFNLSNAANAAGGAADNMLLKDAIFIKEGQYFHKLPFSDILYLEGDGAYINFHTEKRKFLVRGSIPQYMEKMSHSKFFRVHRSYAVNLEKVDTINTSVVIINGVEIPISRNFRDELFTLINVG